MMGFFDNRARPPNKARGEIALDLAGRKFTMRPTFEAIAAIEAASGHDTGALLMLLLGRRVRAVDLAVILQAGIAAGNGGEAPSLEKIGALILRAGLAAALEPATAFLIEAITGGERVKKKVPARESP